MSRRRRCGRLPRRPGSQAGPPPGPATGPGRGPHPPEATPRRFPLRPPGSEPGIAPEAHLTRGTGLLIVLIFGLIAVLSVFIVYQGLFGTQLTGQTSRLVEGARLESLCRSALEEVRSQIVLATANPRSELGRLFREEVFAPDTGARSLSDRVALAASRELLETGAYRGCALGPPEASILFQHPLEASGYERWGRVRIRTTAVGPGPRPVTRSLTAEYGFQVVISSIPRPFDEYGLFVADSGSWIDPGWLNDRRRELIDEVDELRSGLPRLKMLAPPGLAKSYDELAFRILDRPTLDQRLPAFPATTAPALVALWFEPQALSLPNLAVTDRLRADLLARQPVLDAFRQALARVRDDSETDHRDLLHRFDDLIAATDEVTLALWTFQNGVTLVGSDDPAHAELMGRRNRLRFAYFRDRAAVVFRAGGTGDPTRQLTGLWARAGRVGGVVAVEGAGAGLRLTGSWPGTAVVALEGMDVVLEDLSPGPAPGDRLTIAVFGGSVEVRGRVRAALLAGPGIDPVDGSAADPVIRIGPGAVIEGALVLDRPAPESTLSGTVIRDERYRAVGEPTSRSSGILPDHLWVAHALEPSSLAWDRTD